MMKEYLKPKFDENIIPPIILKNLWFIGDRESMLTGKPLSALIFYTIHD
jgi:hypothetical protein